MLINLDQRSDQQMPNSKQGLWQQLQQRESELCGPGVRIPAVLAVPADRIDEGISNLQHALSHVLTDAKHMLL